MLLAIAIVLVDKIRKSELRKIFSAFVILLIVIGFVVFKVFSSIQMLVGYSVFAFSGISFIVDQYKDKKEYSITDILVYLFFFPKMLAGPIVRASDFIPQLTQQLKWQDLALYKGFKLVLFGGFLKFIIADNLLDMDAEQTGICLFLQSLVWGVRFYMDFYSYSIIAVGLALWCGIKLPYNFDNPYSAKSFRDFWKRWNITLTSWLRGYVYIPLGGSRMTKSRMLLNIFLTFIISGLWHGISFPFLLWGCCHGVLVCIEKFLCLSSDSMTSVCKMLYRLFVVIVTMQLWQLFRFKNIGELLEYSKRMFINSEFKGQIIVSLLIAVVSLFVIENRCIKSLVFSMATSKNHIICEVSLLALMLALLLLCPYKYTFNFFYFNF
ncbi:MAG: MBOAT family protein [Prevotella sp.]|nr:MBOAT family protein [Prevotella sp.]